MFPRYSYPWALAPGLAAAVLFGGARSFRRDAQACLARLAPPLRLLGAEHVPSGGPCLITFNHYYRAGFHAWWLALAVAATVPAEIHFVMTDELTFPGKWYAPLGQAGSRWLLKRLGKIYAFTTMPPMPPRPKDVERRARSVRNFLDYARAHPQAILGLAPEGGDQAGGVLSRPPSGAGRFVALLSNAGYRIVPAGAYEENGEFCLRFGPAYAFTPARGLSPDEREIQVAREMMARIAALLPQHLRGEFA